MKFKRYLNCKEIFSNVIVEGNKYLLEKVFESPDKFYKVHGSVTWFYEYPHLYWGNPKEQSIMRDGKEFRSKKWMTDNQNKGGYYEQATKMGFEKTVQTGEVTHNVLGFLVYGGKPHGSFSDMNVIKGRTNKKDHGVWHLYSSSPMAMKRWERIFDKAMDSVYKYIK